MTKRQVVKKIDLNCINYAEKNTEIDRKLETVLHPPRRSHNLLSAILFAVDKYTCNGVGIVRIATQSIYFLVLTFSETLIFS